MEAGTKCSAAAAIIFVFLFLLLTKTYSPFVNVAVSPSDTHTLICVCVSPLVFSLMSPTCRTWTQPHVQRTANEPNAILQVKFAIIIISFFINNSEQMLTITGFNGDSYWGVRKRRSSSSECRRVFWSLPAQSSSLHDVRDVACFTAATTNWPLVFEVKENNKTAF